MITKLALISRIAPGLFRRLPMITSLGYAMPKGRFIITGASVSAALHAAVFFGIPAPTPIDPPEQIIGVPPDPIPPEELALFLPPDPPEKAEKGVDTKEVPADPADDARSVRRLPDPIGRPEITPADFKITVPEAGSFGSGASAWTVPAYTAGPRDTGKAGTAFLLKDLDDKPVNTRTVAPRYPVELRHDGVSGTVLLRFVVDSRGDVVDPVVVKSDYAEFGRAAVDAILRWKFKPGRKNGRSVNTLMEIPMVFSVDTRT